MSITVKPVHRIAVIDMGTNTFHLLIGDVFSDGSTRKVFQSKQVVKLGENGIHLGTITEDAMERAMKALLEFVSVIKEKNADQVNAYATAAVRLAKNGTEFIETVYEKTGIRAEIISGEEEARLICLGVMRCIELDSEPVLIMDIGGGSTEFIIADSNTMHARHSFNIGAALLLEIFKPSDPISKSEIGLLEEFLNETLKPLDDSMKRVPAAHLIGSSGSFDTFAEMIGRGKYDTSFLQDADSYTFILDDFYELQEKLLQSTFAQRLQMKGLIRMRVDMIVLAGICTRFVLERYAMKKMSVSKFALKEGAMYELSGKLTYPNRPEGISVQPGIIR